MDGSLVKKQDIGTYMVVFVAEFSDGVDFIRKEATLLITIKSSEGPSPDNGDGESPDNNKDYPDLF